MRLVSGSQPIDSLADWRQYAPPKGGDRHWVAGRSAMELANAWCGGAGPVVPDEVAAALRSHPDLATLRIVELTPEARVRFDKRRGEPRNADLAGFAEDDEGSVVVHVEGKADETFGQRVRDVRESAQAIVASGKATGAVDRVADLLVALVPVGSQASAEGLRYQLLTATAATLADAERRQARRAVLIVHEFVTDQTSDDLHRANAADLDAFVSVISDGAFTRLAAGTVIGPITVPGAPLIESPVPLYIAKAVRHLRAPSA
jgi:hypothetical protein